MVFVSDSSGRFATSYVPNCVLEEKLKKKTGIKDDYEYRMYLQRNGDKIIKKMSKNTKEYSDLICDCPRCHLISDKDYFNKLEKFRKKFNLKPKNLYK